MIRNIKIHNILDIIEIFKSKKPDKIIHKIIFLKNLFKCFFMIFKVWWVQENQGATFLVVSPKDEFTCNVVFLQLKY